MPRSTVMTNLAGNDMRPVLEAFDGVSDDKPTCFIAYTIKGFGLPFAGHKDNHAGVMTIDQMAIFKKGMVITDGRSGTSSRNCGLTRRDGGLHRRRAVHHAGRGAWRRPSCDSDSAATSDRQQVETQEGFGKILNAIAADDSELARRIVTTSPDVTVSTNLGAWVNRRGLLDHTRPRTSSASTKSCRPSAGKTPRGQHLELGIAENNLILIAALGSATSCSARACCRSARSMIPSSTAASMR